MKTLKRLQIAAILLFVAIIIFASFFGVYKKEDFRVKNIIKNYSLGMHFTDKIVFTGNVKKDEEKIIYDSEGNIVEDDGETDYTEENGYKIETKKLYNEDDLNLDNYTKTKKIITKRLKKMGIGEYKISLDKETGEIKITLQKNDEVHEIEDHIKQKGELTIIDKDTKEVLISKDQVKSAKVVYGASQTDTSSTVVYLQVNFNKEGAKKLEEISQIYVKSEEEDTDKDETAEEGEEQTENETDSETENIKYITVDLDGQALSSTYFGEKMSTGVLYVPITQAQDQETLAKQVKEINNVATVVNNGVLPLEYEFSEEEIEVNVSNKNLIIGIAIPSAILLLACIYLIIKFKVKGLVDTLLQIGYIALVLLAIRYTNVVTTIGGIVAIAIFAAINYVFNYIVLKNLSDNLTLNWKTVGKFAIYTIPVYVLAVILAFNKLTAINSFGMSMVWGSFCLYIYNLTITKAVLEMLS